MFELLLFSLFFQCVYIIIVISANADASYLINNFNLQGGQYINYFCKLQMPLFIIALIFAIYEQFTKFLFVNLIILATYIVDDIYNCIDNFITVKLYSVIKYSLTYILIICMIAFSQYLLNYANYIYAFYVATLIITF
jgi:hypothetical protein